MSSVILKVRWNHTKSYRRMNYATSKTIREVLEDIKQKNNIDLNKYLVLHSPPIEGGRGPIWLDNFGQTIEEYGIKDGDTIEVKEKPQIVNICLNDGNVNWADDFNFSPSNKYVLSSILVDFLDEVSDYIPTIAQLIPKGKLEEFCFQHIADVNGTTQVKWINSNRSFYEQDIKPNGYLCLCPLSSIIQKKLGGDIPEKVLKEGFLTKVSIKPHKKTQPKKRYCVIKGNFLSYYTSQSQSSPSGVVPLEYYDITYEMKDKNQLILKPQSNSFTKTLSTYIFESDDSDFKEWFEIAASRSGAGAGNAVFGIPLIKVMQRKSQNGKIPDIIVKSVEYLEQNGLSVEGIFRLSGGASSVTKYRYEFDRGLEVELKRCQDPNVVAGLLKLYVRELPEPLITFDLYDEFLKIDVLSIPVEEAIPRMKSLLAKLPPQNLQVLTYLLVFLKKVADNSEINLMTPQNVSLVFGPNILRPKEGSPQSATLVQVTPLICKIIEIMIVHYQELLSSNQIQTPKKMGGIAVLPLSNTGGCRPVPPQRKSVGLPNNILSPRGISANNINNNNNANNTENNTTPTPQPVQSNWSGAGKPRTGGQRLLSGGSRNNETSNIKAQTTEDSQTTTTLSANPTLEELYELLMSEISSRRSLEEKIAHIEKELSEEREEISKLSDLVQQLFK